MTKRVLLWLIGFLILIAKTARAEPALVVVDLSGARFSDTVCVTTSIPPSDNDKTNSAAANDVKPALDLLSEAALTLEKAFAAINKLPDRHRANVTVPTFDSKLAWGWQKVAFDGAPNRKKFLECFQGSAPKEAARARLVVIDVSLDESKSDKPKSVNYRRTELSVLGTSLHIGIEPRDGILAPGLNQNELAIQVLGGSYEPAATITTRNHRAAIELRPTLPAYSIHLPDGSWDQNAIYAQGVEHSKPTHQLRIEQDVLEGSAIAATKFDVWSLRPEHPEEGHVIEATVVVGKSELLAKSFVLRWTPPAGFGRLRSELVGCPQVVFVEALDVTCSPPLPVAATCSYACVSDGGISVPARVRFYQQHGIEWDDTVQWGHFNLSSFQTPFPPVIKFPAPDPTTPFASYVSIGPEGDKSFDLGVDCLRRNDESQPTPFFSPLKPVPGACSFWLSELPRTRPELAYEYKGGGRFVTRRVQPSSDGTYVLEPPKRRPISVDVRGGLGMTIRNDTAFSPNASFDSALDIGIPVSNWLLLASPGFRLGTRTFQDNRAPETIEDSAGTASLALSGAALHCLPCAGLSWLGWVGVTAGGSLGHPLSNSISREKAGQWKGQGEIGVTYRFQPAEDGVWGIDASVLYTHDDIYQSAKDEFESHGAARIAITPWIYLY